ncbi:unnamed protein product [Chrysoparadoxa australica]
MWWDQGWCFGRAGPGLGTIASSLALAWLRWMENCTCGTTANLLRPWIGSPSLKVPLGGVPLSGAGLAVSEDGVEWKKVVGPLEGGAVLLPSDNPNAWDGLLAAVGDVRVKAEGGFEMLYFGSDDTEKLVRGEPKRGFNLSIGRAESNDGVHWEKSPAPLLRAGAKGDFDQISVGWPVWFPDHNSTTESRMLYHTASTTAFYVGSAKRAPRPPWWMMRQRRQWRQGGGWVKEGQVQLLGSGGQTSFGTRDVIADPTGRHRYLLIAEHFTSSVPSELHFFTSDDGYNWTALHRGPILKKSDDRKAWDGIAVGCPSLVVKDGRYLLYYVGFGERGGSEHEIPCRIGCAASDGLDYETCTFSRVER